MDSRHVRLVVALARELRSEGLTNFKIQAPSETISRKFVILVPDCDHAVAQQVVNEMYVGASCYVINAPLCEINLQKVQPKQAANV